jgi:hypothetical protein
MLPISVEPRAHAKSTSLHPPVENSLEVLPVPPMPPRSWRDSMGLAVPKLARAATRSEDWKCIFGRSQVSLYRGKVVVRIATEKKQRSAK